MKPITTLTLALAFAMPFGGTWPASGNAPAGSLQSYSVTPEFATVPPASWLPDDPADSLYRAGREALRRNDYRRAAQLFRQIRAQYPNSEYVADALYWESFSLYRTGTTDNLNQALELLAMKERRFPRSGTSEDSRALQARIQGELARMGDPTATTWVQEHAQAPTPPRPGNPGRPVRPPLPPGRVSDCDDTDDTRMMALNALLQMDAERAMPVLEKVMTRRDPGSVCLRRKALFLISQKRTDRTAEILLDAARNDPDPEVRGAAVFWLSQVEGNKAVPALDSILRSAKDPELQDKALFALSQQSSPAAREALRAFARRRDVSDEMRAKAVFWIGQSNDPGNAAFLRSLYKESSSEELKDRILFSVSQTDDPASRQWLLGIARNQAEPIEVRKKALFWYGQQEGSAAELVGLYDQVSDLEMKEQLIFVYAQSDEKAATDKLIDIVRRESNPDLRKKALFWLGQSDDPRVIGVLQSVIEQ